MSRQTMRGMAAGQRRSISEMRRTGTKAPARRVLGRSRRGAAFPVAPPRSKLPAGYQRFLASLKDRIERVRVRVVTAANAAMILLYWDIGKAILARQDEQGWGARVIDRLAKDLSDAYPDMRGFSPRNLKYMRAFAAAWPERAIVQEPLAQITWYQNLALLERLREPQARLWYARAAAQHGWSREVLTVQIANRAHTRHGKAVNNFRRAMPRSDSDLAAQVFKDPYLFDFLGTADPRREREVEQALVDHVQRFLLELGTGFAFVGRQVPLEVGDRDFSIDLLFYHLKLRAFVAVELKAVPFEAAFVGQMNLYLSAVDDLLRHPDDKPTIGLLLCRSRDRLVAEYALRGVAKPIGVAEWETKLLERLPEELEGCLPTVEELEAELRSPRGPTSTWAPEPRAATGAPVLSSSPGRAATRSR